MYILGISAFYHDSAAALIHNGNIVSAAQEERFTRIKHDPSFPINAIKFCLENSKLNISDIDYVTYYENTPKKFARLVQTYAGSAPKGVRHFTEAMRVWLNKKIFIKKIIKSELKKLGPKKKFPKFEFFDHHYSHAAASFYPSPFKEAAILCMDGVGEWTTTSAWIGKDNHIEKIWEINFPDSLGLLYSAFTSFCGFRVNSGEYKLMGLAPYGDPIYANLIKKELINVREDGSFKLNLEYFSFYYDFKMTNEKFNNLFNISPREPESKITQNYMDIAASIQEVTTEIVSKLAQSLKNETGLNNLCLSGGVALNCVANGNLATSKSFNDIWIQPASGDAGSSIGAALSTFYTTLKNKREIKTSDSMQGSYLGCSYSSETITASLIKTKLKYEKLADNSRYHEIAKLLNDGNVIGIFNGKMEFGPRALGNRSIIADPRKVDMQEKMNLKIKFRESFRPFAPAVLEEEYNNYFDLPHKSPYMLLVAQLKKKYHKPVETKDNLLQGLEKLKIQRSDFPAITHVDYSARVQTVSKTSNEFFYSIIKCFHDYTGCPMVINTSFNIRGEPIVNTVEDAIKCFMHTNMDILLIENFILRKKDQDLNKFTIDQNYQVYDD